MNWDNTIKHQIKLNSASLEKRLHIIENKMSNFDKLSENLTTLEMKMIEVETKKKPPCIDQNKFYINKNEIEPVKESK